MLPQLKDSLYITDGGLETVLIFHHNIDLPHFAAFVLLDSEKQSRLIHDYYLDYIKIARAMNCGFILESPTWRASPDWASLLGYSADALCGINIKAIKLLQVIKAENSDIPMVVSGCIGPRGDGYTAENMMSGEEAGTYHNSQIRAFKEAGADMVTAITMTYAKEAIGITKAAQARDLPVAISFTVETDGHLPSGQSLKDAIIEVDTATNNGPAYYMLNCAHPEHFEHVLEAGSDWMQRIRGLRCNASKCSHAELDEAEELDDGNPQELGKDIARLRKAHPQLTILGGCCGTDSRHVAAMTQNYC